VLIKPFCTKQEKFTSKERELFHFRVPGKHHSKLWINKASEFAQITAFLEIAVFVFDTNYWQSDVLVN